jgi:hypothetical protein
MWTPYTAPRPQFLQAPFNSTAGLALATVIGLGILTFGYLVEVILGIGQVFNPTLTFTGENGEGSSYWLILQGGLAYLRGAIFLATAIAFLLWLVRSNNNLLPLRALPTEFTSGWAVGWWFIPFANLVRPYQVVRGVWRESDPDVGVSSGYLSSANTRTAGMLGRWWFFWITSNIISNITWRLYDQDKPGTGEIFGILFAVTGMLSIGAALSAIEVVQSITKRQEERFKKVGLLPQPGPPPPQYHYPGPPPPYFGPPG